VLDAAAKAVANRDYKGENNPNWRGGTCNERHLIMSSKAYKEWRKAVYERDGYKCVKCGEPGNGKNLQADHIKAFFTHPELRLEISNGRTLCVDCHKQTDTYGWKMFNQLRKMETV
jgi:5-methylcytosine-specific restriction endonuclease McrA